MVESNTLLHGRSSRSDQNSLISEADPHGLISSFIRCPPSRNTTPNDIFVIWMLSHQHQTTADAALSILDSYGAAMLQSGSDWVGSLRELFLNFVALTAQSASSRSGGD